MYIRIRGHDEGGKKITRKVLMVVVEMEIAFQQFVLTLLQNLHFSKH
jgi:hypothetical protein